LQQFPDATSKKKRFPKNRPYDPQKTQNRAAQRGSLRRPADNRAAQTPRRRAPNATQKRRPPPPDVKKTRRRTSFASPPTRRQTAVISGKIRLFY
jgi:hypothetical protein